MTVKLVTERGHFVFSLSGQREDLRFVHDFILPFSRSHEVDQESGQKHRGYCNSREAGNEHLRHDAAFDELLFRGRVAKAARYLVGDDVGAGKPIRQQAPMASVMSNELFAKRLIRYAEATSPITAAAKDTAIGQKSDRTIRGVALLRLTYVGRSMMNMERPLEAAMSRIRPSRKPSS